MPQRRLDRRTGCDQLRHKPPCWCACSRLPVKNRGPRRTVRIGSDGAGAEKSSRWLAVAVVFVLFHRLSAATRESSRASTTCSDCSPPWAPWCSFPQAGLITPVSGFGIDVVVPVRHGGVRSGVGQSRPSQPSSTSCWDPLASGTLLYGMSIVYGVTGNLELAAIAGAVQNGLGDNIGLVFGICLPHRRHRVSNSAPCLSTCGYPMCMTASPTSVTVFIGTASKLAAFRSSAMRLLPEALAGSQGDWSQMLVVLSVLVDGHRQHRRHPHRAISKRMLAYFDDFRTWDTFLLGILSRDGRRAIKAAMFYMISYVLVAAGAFGMILLLARQGLRGGQARGFPRAQCPQSLVCRHDGRY